MKIKIESGIPVPPINRTGKAQTVKERVLATWKKMRVGDSFTLEDKPAALGRVRALIAHHCAGNGSSVVTRKVSEKPSNKDKPEKWRIWKLRKARTKPTRKERIAEAVRKHSNPEQSQDAQDAPAAPQMAL